MNEQDLSGSEREKELKEKLLAYRALENKASTLVKQQSMFASKILEIQSTIESIDEIKKGKKGANDILFPLGSAAYTKGAIADTNRLIVEVGAGAVVEKTSDEAKAILEKRKRELEETIGILQKEIQNISAMMQKIEADAQGIIHKAQKEGEKFRVVSPE